jgi:hypothetical protein
MEPRVPEQIEVAPIPNKDRYVEYSTFPAPTYVEYVPYTSANDEVYREVAPQQVSYLYVSVSVTHSKTVTSVYAKGKERAGLYFVDYFIYSLCCLCSHPQPFITTTPSISPPFFNIIPYCCFSTTD